MTRFVLLPLLALGCIASSPASADMSTEEKMMEAAAIVLGASSQVGGTVVVQSGESAFLKPRPHFDLGSRTTFAKVGECVYAQYTKAGPGQKDGHHVIDFSKLTGHWYERGDLIEFYSRGTSHCSSNIGGCWQGHLHVMMNNDHQQMIDDVSYILRHGCDANVDQNEGPDPH